MIRERPPLSTTNSHSRGEPAGFQILHEIPGNGVAVRLVHYAAGYRQKPHSHNHHGISFLIAGGLREQVRRREETAAPFSLVIKPAEVTHTDWVGPQGARLLQIQFNADNQPWHESGVGRHSNWRWMHNGSGIWSACSRGCRIWQ